MGDWRKSTYSDGNGGNCVEVADAHGSVLIRDTTDRDGVTLSLPSGVWQQFTNSLR